jgi:AraC-like DNA-binding protein
VDPLSEIFVGMRVQDAVYARLNLTAPFGLRLEAYDHAHLGVVARGNCWLSVDSIPEPLPLTGGDCWLLARGDAHTLRDSPKTPARPYEEVRRHKVNGQVDYGGGGAPTTIITGNFMLDKETSKWITDLLPPLVLFKVEGAKTGTLQATMRLLAAEMEAQEMGSGVVISRLADIIFVQAIRVYATSDECSEPGWLRALADRQISVTLHSIHENFQKPWTVATLASTARMSRSAFAARFKEIVGEAPLEYLTRCRMRKASQLLRGEDRNLAEVASHVGYDSEGAFSKAFKRILGVSPGVYRKMPQKAAPTSRS